MTGDDPIRRKTTTRRGSTITVYDSHKIGYVRFVINGVFQCERLYPESKPFRFGLYAAITNHPGNGEGGR